MHFNNTQAAEVLIFLQENNIDSYEKLDALAEGAADRFHELSEDIRSYEVSIPRFLSPINRRTPDRPRSFNHRKKFSQLS